MDRVTREKHRLRSQVLTRRDALAPDARAARSAALCEQLLQWAEKHVATRTYTTGQAHSCTGAQAPCVGAFLPMGSEVDLRPFVRSCAQRGWRVCLPVTVRDEQGLDLVFVQVAPNAIFADALPDLVLHPLRALSRDDQRLTCAPVVPPQELDLLVVPLVAFDAQGGRLGYGGGCYDRTLPQLAPTARAVGAAFREQQVAAVPREPHDWPLAQVIAG